MLIRSRDDVPINCVSSGSGPDVLLIHGTGMPGASWRFVREVLGQRFTVHGMDRRGHGQSGDAPVYDIELEYQDIAACIDGLATRPVSIVAHSYGAVCALGACLRGAPVDRLVLYEPPINTREAVYYASDVIPAMQAAVARGDAAAALTQFLTGVRGMKQEDVSRMQRLGVWREQLSRIPLVLRELEAVDRYHFSADDYTEWRIPTLLLLGSESPAQYRATAELLHAGLPGSRIELLPGQAHGAIGAAPKLLAETVLRFLS